MDFEEKIDALRMNLELAFHDIEAQRARNEELRASIQELREGIHELRAASADQKESIQLLAKISGDLVTTAQAHERRISALEARS